MAHVDGWSGLFASAFRQSRNAMVLLDEQRRIVDVNAALLHALGRRRDEMLDHQMWEFVEDGPIVTDAEWRAAMFAGALHRHRDARGADGSRVGVQWGATTETATGRRLVLVVALSTSRWGARFRRASHDAGEPARVLSAREREIVRLVADGATGPEIADELHITHDTVRTHVRNAMGKVGARSRAHLVAKALSDDLVLSPPRPDHTSAVSKIAATLRQDRSSCSLNPGPQKQARRPTSWPRSFAGSTSVAGAWRRTC